MAKKLLFILNPAAGKTQSREPLFDALGVLSDAGYLLRIRTTAGRGHAEDIVRWEGAEYDAVVCCGGDGTLNETVSGLMKSVPPMQEIFDMAGMKLPEYLGTEKPVVEAHDVEDVAK